MTTKDALHRQIDDLPDNGEQLQKVSDLIAQELERWNAALRIAEERGWDIEEAHLPSGSILRDKRSKVQDPLLSALEAAPYDDEPLTPEDIRSIAEAREEVARGEVEPWEDVRAELLGRG